MATNFDDFSDLMSGSGLLLWQTVAERASQTYEKVADTLDNEFQIPLSEAQVNEALDKFVVKNVKAILDLHLDIHDGWLRLYATINIAGIYAEVATNLSLIHVQLDRNVQRFVFGQLTNTDILALYCEAYPKKLGIDAALWFYHRLLKKDPLGFILNYIDIARPKDNVLYLDIGRWLKKNKKIMGYLEKVQVNHGFLAEEQLVLKANVNLADVLNFSREGLLITAADDPAKIAKDKADAEAEQREAAVAQQQAILDASQAVTQT